MNTTLPDSNCTTLGTRFVTSSGECRCRIMFYGTSCENYCVDDPNYYLAFLILHQILYPIFNGLLILFGLVVAINFWKQEQKKRKSIAAFALKSFILCCLLRTMYGINPFAAIPTVNFGDIPFYIIYSVPQGFALFAYILIFAVWLQIFIQTKKGTTARFTPTVVAVVVVAIVWAAFITTLNLLTIDTSIRGIIFLIGNYSYGVTALAMTVFELVLAIYMLRYLKKSPKQVSRTSVKDTLRSMSINVLVSMSVWFGLLILLLVYTIRQPWYWEGLIFQTIFRVGEIALIFLGIRLLGAGSLLLELKFFAYHLGLIKISPSTARSEFVSSAK